MARAAAAADGAGGWTFAEGGLAIAALAALAVMAGFLVRTRHRLSAANERLEAAEADAALLRALAASSPSAWLAWPIGTDPVFASPGLGALLQCPTASAGTFDAVLAVISAEDASSLHAAVASLRARGEGFDLDLLAAKGDRSLAATGVRAGGLDVLWLRGATDTTSARGALAAMRERFHRVIDALPVPIWLRQDDLSIIAANAGFARAVDAPSPEQAAASGVELLTGRLSRSLAESARASPGPHSLRTHTVVAGSRRLLEITEHSLADTGEILGFALDRTEIEEAEGARDRHIVAHREVLERLAIPIVVFGADMRVKFFNRAYALGQRFEEAWLATEPTFAEVLEALRERRLIPEQADFPAFKRRRLKLFTTLLEPVEEFNHLPDGRTDRVIVAPHPMGGLIFTYEDLTDRLALERSYNTLIAVQRETLDNLYEGIAVFGGDGRLKLSNPAFARMWGFAAQDLADEPHVTEIMSRATRYFRSDLGADAEREKLLTAILDRMPVDRRLERADGTVLDYAKVPLPDGATLMSFIDVTDRTRVESALRERTEALEAADRMKSEFIANVSYELRTPLNAIVGFAEILNNQYFGDLNARQGEYVRGIIQASNRLLALINDILDLAMIEAGRMTLETDKVDVHAMMVSVFNLARDWARKQNQRIEFDCPDDIGQAVADERRLKQALHNLISNAVKFTPTGGSLRVAARREGEYLCFTVADTGIGIAPAQHGEVLEKFARGKDATGRFTGVGLGLALVRHIVELHGGTLSIASSPHQGTEVTCRIPAVAQARIEFAESA